MIRAHKPFLWHWVEESGLQPVRGSRVRALLMKEGGAQVGRETNRTTSAVNRREQQTRCVWRGAQARKQTFYKIVTPAADLHLSHHLSPAADTLVPGSWITSSVLFSWSSHESTAQIRGGRRRAIVGGRQGSPCRICDWWDSQCGQVSRPKMEYSCVFYSHKLKSVMCEDLFFALIYYTL